MEQGKATLTHIHPNVRKRRSVIPVEQFRRPQGATLARRRKHMGCFNKCLVVIEAVFKRCTPVHTLFVHDCVTSASATMSNDDQRMYNSDSDVEGK